MIVGPGMSPYQWQPRPVELEALMPFRSVLLTTSVKDNNLIRTLIRSLGKVAPTNTEAGAFYSLGDDTISSRALHTRGFCPWCTVI